MASHSQPDVLALDADRLLDEHPLPEYLRENVRPGLEMLLLSAAEMTDLNANGRARLLFSIHDDLGRLKQIADDRARFPEIADVEIREPLFIVGLPRCGTSVLHALLNEDPNVRAPLQWEIAYPSPPPERATETTDPRIAKYDAYLWESFGGDPKELLKGHPLGAMIPQECGSFMTSSFQSSNVCMLQRLPRFYEWFKGIDATFRYEVHKMWLQQLSWKNPRKHWVLKIQEHMYKMRELRTVYPDAIFIQPHRDPAQVVASISQLMYVIRSPAYDEPGKDKIGQEFLNLWSDGIEAMMDYRAANPDLPIHDMRFKDLITDPVATIRKAYAQFGRELSDEGAASVLQWLAENPADKHGKRSYSLEEFGLDEQTVRSRFARYTETYRDFV
ncbi:MAG: sulfotransferase family protein [Novosphingobium sp. 32-60-15]|uniref:sulfotransferase family protein n=1 Tax=unclassified Novosphingobium TaxID=2644732 RepID=UPI000BDB0AE3|nr:MULTISPECIES: sulfotransferase [unclassified Novosphingobium]OYX64399.1 MAG: sulfotransferase family protein [Novosphingobium sp. 32-60-15]